MVWYAVKKCYLRPLYFAQKCPQNAGNAVSETQNSKYFQGGHVPGPPYRNVLSLYREGPGGPSCLKMARP